MNKTDCVRTAENVILNLKEKGRRGVIGISSTQMRNLLTLTNALRDQALKENDKLSFDLQSDIQYVKMKFAYAAGRDAKVREFMDETKLLDHLDAIGDDKEKLMVLCRYMESLVAYRKYYGDDER